jgi:hypothetical protein
MPDLLTDEELDHLSREDLDLLIGMVASEVATKRTLVQGIIEFLDSEIAGNGDSEIAKEMSSEMGRTLTMMRKMSPMMYKAALSAFKQTNVKGMEDTVVLLTNLHVKLHLVKSKID